MGKVTLFLLLSPVHPNSYLFVLTMCWNLSAGNLDSHKSSFLWGGALSKMVFSRGSQTVAKRGWRHFMGHCKLHGWDQSLCAYDWTHGWVRLCLSSLVCGAGSHSSHKGTLSVDGC